jgi:hypothetical protein
MTGTARAPPKLEAGKSEEAPRRIPNPLVVTLRFRALRPARRIASWFRRSRLAPSSVEKTTPMRPVFRRAYHPPTRRPAACSLAVTPTSGCNPGRPSHARPAETETKPATTPMEFPLPSTLEHREVGHGCHTVSSRGRPQGFSPSRRLSLGGTSGHFQAGNAPGILALQGFTPTARPADSSPTRYPLGVLPRPQSGGQTQLWPRRLVSRHAHARSFQRLQGLTPAADPYSART